MTLSIGSHFYELVTDERSGEWVAYARRGEHGDRFGIEATGTSAEEATAKLTRWLEWQHEHTQALEALQQAERVYHRAMADAAFSTSFDGVADSERQSSLEAVDAARTVLDDVRARRPNL